MGSPETVTVEVVVAGDVTGEVTEAAMEETVAIEEKIEVVVAEAVVPVAEEGGLVVEAVIVVDADVDLHHTVRCHEADLVLKALQGEDVVVVEGQDLAQDQSDDSKNIGGDRLQ